jgi:hypothetical protein
MTLNKTLLLTAMGLLGISCAAGAQQLLYGNESATYSGGVPIAPDPVYQSFSTGNSAVELSSLTLEGAVSNPLDGGSITVALFADNSTDPAATPLEKIATIADSSLTTYLNAFAVPVSGPQVTLAPDTRYWIGIYGTNSVASSFEWQDILQSANPNAYGVSGQYGKAYGYVFPDPTIVDGYALAPFEMQILGTKAAAAPEIDAATALIALTLLAGAFAVLRDRRQTPGNQSPSF